MGKIIVKDVEKQNKTKKRQLLVDRKQQTHGNQMIQAMFYIYK